METSKNIAVFLFTLLAAILSWLYKTLHGDVEDIKKDYATGTDVDDIYKHIEKKYDDLHDSMQYQHGETNKLLNTLIDNTKK
jgi:hypothetical protein